MADWYMDPAGNDTTGDGSSGNPYLTISKCHTEASDGDTIIVNDGTYASGFVFVAFSKGLTIQAANRGAAILDGNAATTSVYWKVDDGCSGFTVDGIVFQNIRVGTASGPSNYGVIQLARGVYQDCPMLFQYCTFRNIETHLYNSNGGLISRNINDALGAASLTVEYSLFYDIWSRVTITPMFNMIRSAAANHITLTHNSIYLPHDGSVATYEQFRALVYATTSVTCTNNIVHCPNENLQALNNVTANTTTLTNNCWSGFDTPPGGTGAVTSDPLFVDPDFDIDSLAGGDLNLRPSSPCINTGVLL